jgi:hypothetical protein
VTSRGTVVAVMVAPPPSSGDSEEEILAAMEAEGALTRGTARFREFTPVRARKGVRLSRIVIQDRG